MRHTLTKSIVITGLAFLAACDTTSDDPVFSAFNREAGALIDTGHFGGATLNNTQIMSGEKQYTIDLANRFANEVTSTVNFAFNSARLDGHAVSVLRQQAQWIKQFPEVRFRVYGHTDAVGSNAYNRRLGQRRANAVVRYFTSQGISRKRLEAVVSLGETQPLIFSQGEEAQNRRTVTEVSGFVKRHPGVLDGKYAAIIYRDYVESAASITTVTPTKLGNEDG